MYKWFLLCDEFSNSELLNKIDSLLSFKNIIPSTDKVRNKNHIMDGRGFSPEIHEWLLDYAPDYIIYAYMGWTPGEPPEGYSHMEMMDIADSFDIVNGVMFYMPEDIFTLFKLTWL